MFGLLKQPGSAPMLCNKVTLVELPDAVQVLSGNPLVDRDIQDDLRQGLLLMHSVAATLWHFQRVVHVLGPKPLA